MQSYFKLERYKTKKCCFFGLFRSFRDTFWVYLRIVYVCFGLCEAGK